MHVHSPSVVHSLTLAQAYGTFEIRAERVVQVIPSLLSRGMPRTGSVPIGGWLPISFGYRRLAGLAW